jgi:hypothetical protein
MKFAENDFIIYPGVPPWMWFFVVMFTLNLPAVVGAWQSSYEGLQLYIRSAEQLQAAGLPPRRFAVLAYPGFFTERLPGLALFVGLFTIVCPWLRTHYIERRNSLILPPPSFKALTEIKDFVAAHAPGLGIKVNLTRPGLIWTYPNGYRHATVAVFSGFVMLWKTDRDAAEAVLLHEIAHYRRGDALFLGPGSFLESAVKATLVFYAVFVALPYIATSIDQQVQFIQSLQENDASLRDINKSLESLGLETQPEPNHLPAIATSIFLRIFGLLTTTMAFLVYTASSFVLPVACMWAAELNADHLVANAPTYQEAIWRELNKKRGNVAWWRRILFRLSHPPDSLRRFFVRHNNSSVFTMLLLLFPLAIFVRIAVLHVWVFVFQQGTGSAERIAGGTTGFTLQRFAHDLIENTHIALTAQPSQWILMAGLLLIWTIAVRP